MAMVRMKTMKTNTRTMKREFSIRHHLFVALVLMLSFIRDLADEVAAREL